MNIVDLAILKKMVAGGGGSGTDNYNDLSNLPQINGETLAGNKTAANLGLQDALTFDSAPTEDSTNPVESGGVYTALAGKQDTLTFDGVYNASTNKAATESTVTNAINGLDVSALSVDADETISSISESDGKISVTKQDIAIASNQVTAMTGYTKPSSAPATPAIQQDDTANTAFGKLEYKADTNQTNILYVSEHNANRNLLLNTASTTTIDGVTFTVNADKSVTITGSQNNPNQHTKFVLGKFTANRSDLVLDSGIAASASANIFINTQDGVTTTRNLGHATITGTDLNTERDYQILIIAGTSNINTTIKPMICTQADWNATQEYEASGGLQNSDLTYLEAEDRAALAEVVDSGAKNVARENNITYTGTNTAPAADCYCDSITGSIHVHIDKIQSTDTDSTLCYYRIIYNDDTYDEGNFNRNIVIDIDIYTSKAVKKIAIYPSSNAPKSIGDTVTITNIMICTKAAFCISPKFVPYRPDYQALVDKTTEQTFGIFKYNNNYSITAVTRKCNGFAWFTLSATSTANIAANTNTIIGFVDADVQPAGASTDRVIFTARVNTDPPSLLHSHIRGGDGYIYINSPTAIPAGTSISITGSYKY